MLCTAHSTVNDMKYLLALEEETYLLLATALILEKPEQLSEMCRILSYVCYRIPDLSLIA